MSDVENDLRVRVDAFVGELAALIRRQALLAVEEVLHKGDGEARPGRRGSAGAGRGRAPGIRAVSMPKRRAGEKRSQDELARITGELYAYVKSNGGQSIEQIAKGLGTSTKELTLPIRKLLRDKKVSSKGQKRATRYSAR
jgi:hypothetical protein